jgi:ATP synthase protein I
MAKDPQQRKSNAGRYYGIGMELAAAVVGFTLLGYWIDRHFGTEPWALVICIALGLVGGTYNLIRSSLSAAREDAERAREADGDPQDR